jgi:hypothetical protein
MECPTPCEACDEIFDLEDGKPCHKCHTIFCPDCAQYVEGTGWRCEACLLPHEEVK